MMDIKLLSKNKYLKVPLLSGTGGHFPPWRQHLQPCKYLETDGNAYIQTSFNANNITEISCICQQNASGTIFGCGAATQSTDRRFGLSCYNNNYFLWSWSKGSERTLSNVASNELLEFSTVKSNRIAVFNNANVSYANIPSNLNKYQYLAIFAGNYLEGLLINPGGLKIMQITSNLFYLKPCYVIDSYIDNKNNVCSDGVAGMVDTLTGVFYTNDGSGQFIYN